MNFNQNNSDGKNTNTIKELKPQFRSMKLAPCTLKSNKTNGIPHIQGASTFGKLSQGQEQIVTDKSRWSVVDAKPVPVWGLEKGTEQVYDRPSIVSTRIVECLRLRSVQAQFDADRAEAECKTIGSLRYNIYLYAGADDSTHVEVMMMGGCKFSFKKERQLIMNAAKGLGAVDAAPSAPKRLKIPSNLKSLYVPPSVNDLESTLQRASDQIHSNQCDTVLFALQNLAFKTNGEKAHFDTAQKLSKLLMQNRSEIRDLIVSVYVALSSEMKDETSEQICDACLCILENGIISLSKNDGFLDRECKCLVEEMIPSLVQNLKSSKCHRHACLALRCLSLLVDNSSLACEAVDKTNIGSVIEHIVELGRREHLMLEKTAMSTRDVLRRKLDVY